MILARNVSPSPFHLFLIKRDNALLAIKGETPEFSLELARIGDDRFTSVQHRFGEMDLISGIAFCQFSLRNPNSDTVEEVMLGLAERFDELVQPRILYNGMRTEGQRCHFFWGLCHNVFPFDPEEMVSHTGFIPIT
jgi:hypothetical protein